MFKPKFPWILGFLQAVWHPRNINPYSEHIPLKPKNLEKGLEKWIIFVEISCL